MGLILSIITISAWLALTLMIDIAVVPTVFRNSSQIFEAGHIGIILFTLLNRLEILFASVVFLTSFKWARHRLITFISAFLVILILCYNFLLTPGITQAAKKMEAHQAATDFSQGFAKAQDEHRQYHDLYKVLDSTKMFLLLGLLIYAARENKRRFQ